MLKIRDTNLSETINIPKIIIKEPQERINRYVEKILSNSKDSLILSAFWVITVKFEHHSLKYNQGNIN